MFEDRRYAAKADKDGGGRNEKYEIGVEMNYGEMLIR